MKKTYITPELLVTEIALQQTLLSFSSPNNEYNPDDQTFSPELMIEMMIK